MDKDIWERLGKEFKEILAGKRKGKLEMWPRQMMKPSMHVANPLNISSAALGAIFGQEISKPHPQSHTQPIKVSEG